MILRVLIAQGTTSGSAVPIVSGNGPIQLWVGFGFVALLIVFMMVAYFRAGPGMSEGQYRILAVLASMCGGFAAAFITGGTILSLSVPVGGTGSLAINAVAGFAVMVLLFMAMWFYAPKEYRRIPDSFSFSTESDWNFGETIDAICSVDGKTPDLTVFTNDELAAKVQARQITARDLKEALSVVRHITVTKNVVRPYSVRMSSSVVTFEVL